MNRTKLRENLEFLRQQLADPEIANNKVRRARIETLITRFEERLDPRLGLTRRYPKWMQPALTWLTGKAGDEKPLWKNTALSSYLVNVGMLFGAAIGATALLNALPHASGGYKLLLGVGAGYLTLITAGAVRASISTYLHHSTHRTYPTPAFWKRWTEQRLIMESQNAEPGCGAIRTPNVSKEGRLSWNRLLGEIVSTLTLGTPWDMYKRDHDIHHSAKLATWDDPDWQFLFKFGNFRPGQSRAAYWKQLWKTLLSPRYHMPYMTVRLFDNLWNLETPMYRRLAGQAYYLAFAWAVAYSAVPFLWFLVVWGIAVVPLANSNALLQLLSEHLWQRLMDSKDKKTILARKMRGRFVSPPLPEASFLPLRWVQWGWWWMRVLLWHLPVERLFVWPADLGSHDWHHRHVGNEDWPNSAYARRADIEAGTPNWAEPYQEDVWGLREALNQVFDLLSSLPPYEGPDNLSYEEERKMFQTM